VAIRANTEVMHGDFVNSQYENNVSVTGGSWQAQNCYVPPAVTWPNTGGSYRWPTFPTPQKHAELCPVCRGSGKYLGIGQPEKDCHGCNKRGWVEVG